MSWGVDSYLLARIAHLLAGANWQRGGGKGPKPKPVKVPDGKTTRPKRDRGQDAARRLRNLGLIPGQPHQRVLTPQEQKLAEALQRAQERNEPKPD